MVSMPYALKFVLVLIFVGCKCAGPLTFCNFCTKNTFFNQKKEIFLLNRNGDVSHNLNEAPDMSYSKFSPNYDL